LVTLLTAYSLESRAGFISHRRRSWDSPFGGFTFPEVSAGFRLGEPTYRSLGGVPDAEAPNRPSQAAVSGSMPPGSASRPCECLARQSPAPPLGFAPLGPTGGDLGLDFSGPPLARFAGSAITRRIRRRLRVSIGLRLAPPDNNTGVRAGWDYPSGVLAPARS